MKGIAYYKSQKEIQCEKLEQNINDLKRLQHELMPEIYIDPDLSSECDNAFYSQPVSLYHDKKRGRAGLIINLFLGGVIILILFLILSHS